MAPTVNTAVYGDITSLGQEKAESDPISHTTRQGNCESNPSLSSSFCGEQESPESGNQHF